ncbi:MAG: tetratricopeptide repeat protein [Thermodesulfobacteriota bacterium]
MKLKSTPNKLRKKSPVGRIQSDIARGLQEGIAAHREGRLEDALQTYIRILSLSPKHPDALHLIGMVAYGRKQYTDAIEWIQKAIAVQPQEAMFHYNLGASLYEAGRYREAVEAYRKALSLKPDYAEVYSNLGNTLKRLGDFEGAIESFQKAVRLKPDFADAYCNLGIVLADIERMQDAEVAYQKALNLNPRCLQAWHNYGNLLRDTDRFTDAITSFRNALSIDDAQPETLNNLGHVLLMQGDVGVGLQYIRKAWDIKPDYWDAGSNLLMGLHYAGPIDPQMIFRAHRIWGDRVMTHVQRPDESPTVFPRNRLNGDKIRIGYVSPDFRTHSVAYFIEPILAHHDRRRFHITAYSDAAIEDETSQRIKGYVDVWRKIAHCSNEDVFQQIREDGIDLLVDLAGHTARNRLVLFARRPAPVQVTYLGYPDTTGLKTMDYRLTDVDADPPGMTESLHTERLLRLETGFLCYRPREDAPEVAPAPCTRTGFVTFASFNNLAKISDIVLDAWCRILQRTPGSRMIVKAQPLRDVEVRQWLIKRFVDRGVDSDRIRMEGMLSYRDHLGLYNDVDIALDTFPYHGTTTTCEALWMGVPVLTAAGRTHVSRVGCSILHRIGMDELVAFSLEDYVEKAVELAIDNRRLVLLRQGMRHRIRASTLVDGRSVTGCLEKAYCSMMEAIRNQEDRSDTSFES